MRLEAAQRKIENTNLASANTQEGPPKKNTGSWQHQQKHDEPKATTKYCRVKDWISNT